MHAPHFPEERWAVWWVILASKSNFEALPVKVADLAMNGTKTVTLQFKAPSRPGPASLGLVVRADGLVGADVHAEIKYTVASKASPSGTVEAASNENDAPQ